MRKLKSTLIEEFDFREADVSGEDFTYEIDKEFIEKEILRIRKKNKVLHEVEEVKKGDIVVCSLKSINPKFNKENVSISAGLGLFNREIEMALIGMKKGESKAIDADNESVIIDVINVKRSVMPELTDEMVQKEKIDNITNVKSLMEYLEKLYKNEKNKAIDNKSYNLVENVINQVIAKSKFDINEEDIQYLSELEIHKARVFCELEGLTIEKMTAEDFNGKIPVKSYDEFLKMVNGLSKHQLPVLLLGLKNAEKDGYKVSQDEYAKDTEDFCKMYHMKPEDAYRAMAFEYYETGHYTGHFRNIIREYYRERYQEV
jgi:FKBP-type peptidyl-prolyl cis-trans isomerase (trigger factor)